MRIEEGNIIELEDNKDYMVIKKINHNNTNYVYLVTAAKPIEVLFMKENDVNGELSLVPIDDSELVDIIPLFEN